jgi:uncharacterized Fe-S cluster protein YjdI
VAASNVGCNVVGAVCDSYAHSVRCYRGVGVVGVMSQEWCKGQGECVEGMGSIAAVAPSMDLTTKANFY